jgi:hypothetical protein
MLKGMLQVPRKHDYSVSALKEIECLATESPAGHRQLKLHWKGHDSLSLSAALGVVVSNFTLQYNWLARLANTRLALMGVRFHELPADRDWGVKLPGAHTEGMVLKRSKYLREWKARYGVVTEEALLFYKQPGDKPSVRVEARDVREIKTEFAMQEGCLEVVVKHGIHHLHLGIPVVDYMYRGKSNWLQGLYSLLLKHN